MFLPSRVALMSGRFIGETHLQSHLPLTSVVLSREKYKVVCDLRNKIPFYVYERLTTESLKGRVKRKGHSFCEDIDIPRHVRARLSDYQKSGYDKGHACAAAHCCESTTSMSESFLLTNSIPQNSGLNVGHWLKLEKEIRKLVEVYDVVEVYSGGVFLPKKCRDGKRRVIYEVIGEGNVAVPTHFFKTLYMHQDKSVDERAYLLPNRLIPQTVDLESFRSTVKYVERISGILFSKRPEVRNRTYPVN